MRLLVLIAVLVIVIVWDFAQNGGGLTNAVIEWFIHMARSAGF